ncbi:MAG TPA: DUF4838 domain-containing protein [Candidatus Hydrogenedentes bacterium]|nr:DUF4838 domain-containing protein [Candidatus Hydrogenedentota bacterium]
MTKSSVFIFISLLVASASAAARAPWLSSDSYADVCVVVADSASDSEQRAAQEFAKYWQRCTGHDVLIGNRPENGVCVWIGRGGVPAGLLSKVKLERLGTDGLHLRTVKTGKVGANPHLLIVGGRERGTLYGVYEFFERYMGVRWLTPDVTHIPEPPASLPRIDYRYVPPFEFRDTTYYWWLNPHSDMEYADAEKDALYNGINRINSGPSFACHTLHRQIPPDKYFEDHPEYYSFYDGKRHGPVGVPWWLGPGDMPPDMMTQLCFTNPDVVKLLYEAVERDIQNNPANKEVHISQMDWFAYCECEACAAIDAREESHMGSVLTALNQIADWLAEEHPGYSLETLAYLYTRKPPKYLRPRDNVIIKLCSIECDFGRPLDDSSSALNRPFVEDIRKWSKVAKRLHVWDYTPNYTYAQIPHPNFHVLQPNAQFFMEHKVKGLFEQGFERRGCESEPLRAYMIHKLLWNPLADGEAIKDEFIDLYYQAAAPYIRQYIRLLTKRVQESGLPLPCFNNGEWLDFDTVVEADRLFQKAFAAAPSDPIRRRVDRAYLPVQCAALICPPRVTLSAGRFVVERPPSLTYKAYAERVKAIGTRPDPHGYDPLKILSALVQGKTPSRRQESSLEILENEYVALWIAPQLYGAVVRWQDKAFGVELLRGYEHFGALPTIWREYTHTPPIGQPIAEAFEVIERDPNTIALQAKLDDGLTVTKRLTLSSDSSVVEFALTIQNESDKAVVPLIKSVPEFFTQGAVHPEVWTELDGQWQQMNPEPAPSRLELLPEEDYTRLAVRFPKAKLTLVSEFTPGEARPLLFAYRSEDPYNQLNLDVLPDQAPLDPGASRTATVRYLLTRKRPHQLK